MKRKSDFWTRKITDSIVFMRVRNYRTGLLSVTEEEFSITSYGNDFQEVKKSYQNIDKLHFDKMNLEKI
jgi:phosphoribosylamine--glycine ligase